MASPKRNRQQSQNGGENDEIWVIFAVGIILCILWFAYKSKIVALILGVRLGESFIISLFTDNLNDLRLWMKGIDRKRVTLNDLFVISQTVGSYVRFVTTPILIWFGYKLYKSSPTEKFRRVFTHETLPNAQADLYPWMKISTKIDFAKMDPEIGPWAYAKTERMFAREHKLKTERGGFDHEKAERIFVRQLGPIWMGYKNLKPHLKALFAMLIARMNKDFNGSNKLLMQFAESAAAGEMNYSGVDEIATKYMESTPMKRILRTHAYERTVLMAMLERARGEKDYLPPNWFLWLKGVDRELWYAMSDTGRKTPHVESGGVFAHWLVEKTRGKRLEMPFVKKAVEGLEGELNKFTEDGDRTLAQEDELLELHIAEELAIPTPEQAEKDRLLRGMQTNSPRNRNLEDNNSDE